MSDRKLIGIGALLVALVVALIVGWAAAYKQSARDVSFVLNEKERVCSSSGGSCTYLLFTDGGTYKLADTLLFWRFSTSDVYGRLKPGQTYDATVAGWRIPFLSAYPNVVEVR